MKHTEEEIEEIVVYVRLELYNRGDRVVDISGFLQNPFVKG